MLAKQRIRVAFLAIALAVLVSHVAHGEVAGEEAEAWRQSYMEALRSGKSLWKSTPKYHAETDSYFQFVRDTTGGSGRNGVHWDEAVRHAKRMTYKGRRGRLAIIDSADLYGWILRQWDLTTMPYAADTWIGLRYWCPYRELAWSNGTKYSFAAFTPWAVPWYRTGYTPCAGGMSYMGVYIEGNTLRWQATPPNKAFLHYIVEYSAEDESGSENATQE